MFRKNSLRALVMMAVVVGGLAIAGGKKGTCDASAKACSADAATCSTKMAAYYQEHGWIGIETKAVGTELFAEISQVHANSPAARAGFQNGDVLVAVNGVWLKEKNKADLKAAKSAMKIGTKSKFVVKRNGEKVKLTAIPAAMPEAVLANKIGSHILDGHLQAVAVN